MIGRYTGFKLPLHFTVCDLWLWFGVHQLYYAMMFALVKDDVIELSGNPAFIYLN